MFVLRFALLATLLPPAGAFAADPPKQPDKGPGGAEYLLSAAQVMKRVYGRGAEQVYVFWPSEPPRAGKRQIIVFLHAYAAMSPHHYGAWIEHLVRRGNVVIYPRMQAQGNVARAQLTTGALAGLKAALAALERDMPGIADLSLAAYVGHSAGAIVAANLAAMAAKSELPKPVLVFGATPGNSHGSERLKTPLSDLAALPATALVVTTVANGDNIAREIDARNFIRNAVNVPPANKMLVKMFTDDHGRPVLLANHNAATAVNLAYEASKIPTGVEPAPVQPPAPPPTGRGQRRPVLPPVLPPLRSETEPDFGGAAVNSLDWSGFWKVLDLALEAGFAGKDASPIKNHPGLANMGLWTDGWPVKRLTFESAREGPPPSAVAPATPARPGVGPTRPGSTPPRRP